MKKILVLLFMTFFMANNVLAANYDSKVQLTAKRQIYRAQLKTLDSTLKTTIDEYSSIMSNEKLSTAEKQKKMVVLEDKIMKINADKLELKEQYKQDKKAIKEKQKSLKK